MSLPKGSMATASATGSGKPYLHALTGLRFFAAFQVLLHHYVIVHVGVTSSNPALQVFLNLQYLGLNLFFVLSGFVIAYNYLDKRNGKPFPSREFFVARFARIYPVYLVGLVLAFPQFLVDLTRSADALGVALASGAGASALRLVVNGLLNPGTILTGLLSIVLSLTMMQAWVPQVATLWNGPGWTVSCEIAFYFSLPFLAPIVARWPLRRLVACCVILWLATLAVTVVAESGGEIQDGVARAFFYHNPLMWFSDFLIGIATGVAFLRRADWVDKIPILILSLVAIGIAVVIISRPENRVYQSAAFTPLFAAFVFGLASDTGIIARFLSTRFMMLLGDASYATYLIHFAFHFWFVKVMARFGLDSGGLSEFLLYASLTIGISILLFLWFERPARSAIRRWLAGSRGNLPHTRAEPAAESDGGAQE